VAFVRHRPLGLVVLVLLTCCRGTSGAVAQTTTRLVIRGHAQTLRLYGPIDGEPVIVSSGDGGWIHLAPHVAHVLAANGFFVVGLDVKAYLESFTSGHTTLVPDEVPADYEVLAEFAARRTGKKPTLVGVSEGAGLSVLAAAAPRTKSLVAGVIGLGLPGVDELGWRVRDSVTYFTHRIPNEPVFTVAALVGKLAPLPLGAIHSTEDEFVPLAQVQRLMRDAGEPKQLWIVRASDHRFSDNQPEFDRRLLEAMAWVRQNAPH
jgi:alpha-beta hydrolase superfamily lysophospholipase